MFEILRPTRTYYFDNIVTPSAFIPSVPAVVTFNAFCIDIVIMFRFV